MERATHCILPDGRRLHLSHGPIDIVAGAEGDAAEVAAAYRQAVARFDTVLTELVVELPRLRAPVPAEAAEGGGPRAETAARMWAAVLPHAAGFVTPMAAVAGAVAETVLAAMVAGRRLTRAHVNNGGDIALHLPPGAPDFRAGLVVDPADPRAAGAILLRAGGPVRGLASSGAPGRSFSLGIADNVTVLAATAAQADVAATLLANAVDLPGHPAILREPAQDIAPDSDLGPRRVTRHVGPLTSAEIARALDAGEARALAMLRAGLIHGAVLVLRGTIRPLGDVALLPAPRSEHILSLAERGLEHA